MLPLVLHGIRDYANNLDQIFFSDFRITPVFVFINSRLSPQHGDVVGSVTDITVPHLHMINNASFCVYTNNRNRS